MPRLVISPWLVLGAPQGSGLDEWDFQRRSCHDQAVVWLEDHITVCHFIFVVHFLFPRMAKGSKQRVNPCPCQYLIRVVQRVGKCLDCSCSGNERCHISLISEFNIYVSLCTRKGRFCLQGIPASATTTWQPWHIPHLAVAATSSFNTRGKSSLRSFNVAPS